MAKRSPARSAATDPRHPLARRLMRRLQIAVRDPAIDHPDVLLMHALGCVSDVNAHLRVAIPRAEFDERDQQRICIDGAPIGSLRLPAERLHPLLETGAAALLAGIDEGEAPEGDTDEAREAAPEDCGVLS